MSDDLRVLLVPALVRQGGAWVVALRARGVVHVDGEPDEAGNVPVTVVEPDPAPELRPGERIQVSAGRLAALDVCYSPQAEGLVQ